MKGTTNEKSAGIKQRKAKRLCLSVKLGCGGVILMMMRVISAWQSSAPLIIPQQFLMDLQPFALAVFKERYYFGSG